MAGLTANRPTDSFGGADSTVIPRRIFIPIADAVHIYQGALVQLDSSGNANPASGSSNLLIVGRAVKEYDNTSTGPLGSNHAVGAFTVEVEQGAFSWDAESGHVPTQATVGASVYAADDHTISTLSSSRASVGRLLGITGSKDGELGTQYIVQTIWGLT